MSTVAEVLDTLANNGWNIGFQQGSSASSHPCHISMTKDGETRNIRVYSWELTDNGAATGTDRPEDERRIQVTRTENNGGIILGGGFETLILGYSDQFSGTPVIASFNPDGVAARINTKLATKASLGVNNPRVSDSQQIKQANIDAAMQQGISIGTNQRGDQFRVVRADQIDLLFSEAVNPAEVPAGGVTEPPNIQTIAAAEVQPSDAGETVSLIESLLGGINQSDDNELQITVNLEQRREAQRRHDEIVRKFNNEVAARIPTATILDRDLPGWNISSIEGCQPDFGARLEVDNGAPTTIIIESKSMPEEAGGQWSQVIVALGELARYSYEYREAHDSQPIQVLALERAPDDENLRSFLESLRENNEVVVVWDSDNGFDSFESHKNSLDWLFS